MTTTKSEYKKIREELIKKDPTVLADALLSLAVQDERVDEVVERIIATADENVDLYKKKLAGLKRRKDFINWSAAREFSRELNAMLMNLKSGVSDPNLGMRLVADFFRADSSVLEACDDSSGDVGNVFRFTAADMFAYYAQHCDDKKGIMDLVLELVDGDCYGVRDPLIDNAHQYLPEDIIRQTHGRKSSFWSRYGK